MISARIPMMVNGGMATTLRNIVLAIEDQQRHLLHDRHRIGALLDRVRPIVTDLLHADGNIGAAVDHWLGAMVFPQQLPTLFLPLPINRTQLVHATAVRIAATGGAADRKKIFSWLADRVRRCGRWCDSPTGIKMEAPARSVVIEQLQEAESDANRIYHNWSHDPLRELIETLEAYASEVEEAAVSLSQEGTLRAGGRTLRLWKSEIVIWRQFLSSTNRTVNILDLDVENPIKVISKMKGRLAGIGVNVTLSPTDDRTAYRLDAIDFGIVKTS